MSEFWKMRSKGYGNLFWSKDISYINTIVNVSDLSKTDLVLDMGTGTGIIAKNIKEHVKHVIAVDDSEDMLNQSDFNGISFLKWDITNKIFINDTFDKILARMVFHHVLENVQDIFDESYNLLKTDGMLIVAEGVPPSDDPEVVDWFANMFKYKEERLTFTERDLINHFKKSGFEDIKTYTYIIKDFSINNWLDNSGIPQENIDIIKELHYNSNSKIKNVYNMKFNNQNCTLDSKNIIITGKKCKNDT